VNVNKNNKHKKALAEREQFERNIGNKKFLRLFSSWLSFIKRVKNDG
jgi:hypothetical protein